MRKQHILYDAIADTLKHVSDSPTTDSYSESSEVSSQGDLYARLTGLLRGFNAMIVRAKAERSIDVPFSEIFDATEEFGSRFASYPSFNRTKIGVLLTLAERISVEGVPIDERDIDEAAFAMVLLPESVVQVFYSHTNTASVFDSLVAFDATNLSNLRKVVLAPTTSVSLELLYHLLIQVARHGFGQIGTFAMVRQQAQSISPESALAFTRLSMVADGKPVFRSRVYSLKPNIARRELVTSAIDYQQHSDVIEVLSEYNTRDDLLTKYLTLYHVFENFMCKAPIVELQIQNQDRQISIRDFRVLSTRLLGPEFDSLDRLFRRLNHEKPDGTIRFDLDVHARWVAYVASIGAVEVDRVLAGLNLKNDVGTVLKTTDINEDNIGRYVPRVVYQLRNAVVHNKEVDVHVTVASMSIGLERLIADVAIPALERLCFHLLSVKNDYVWYEAQHLLLHR